MHGLAVVDGVVDCDESFDGDGHCHEDGTSENDLRERPEEIGKEEDVDVGD